MSVAGSVAQAWRQRLQHLQMKGQVRRARDLGSQAAKDAQDENTRLKRLLADAILEDAALKIPSER